MTSKFAEILLLATALAYVGCGTDSAGPTAPSPSGGVQPPAGPTGLSAGVVLDTAFRWVSGATLEVLDGPSVGATTTTDASGQFVLPVASGGHVRVTRDGYAPATHQLNLLHPVIYLTTFTSPVDIAGEYTLTFDADPSCTALPDVVRSRSYAVSITRSDAPFVVRGTAFDLSMPGVELLENPSIGVAGDFVGFKLFNDGYPYIVERLDDVHHLTITGFAGVAAGRVFASPTAAAFDGWLSYGRGSVSQPSGVVCRSSTHRLTIARR